MAARRALLEHRVALVTGGARGLGFACASALADHGARVIITSRDADPGEAAALQLDESGHCEAIVADLRTYEGVIALADQVRRRHAGIDILVNNAGVTWGAPFEEYPDIAWSKLMRLNVAAPFQVVQSILDLLERRATPSNPAKIVNIGSIDGYAVGPYDNFAYGASKAALHHLTTILARRLAGRSITVNCVAPGPIWTDMTAPIIGDEDELVRSTPLGRLAEATDVGEAVLYLCASSGDSITGCVIPVDGGLSLRTWGRGTH